MQYFAVFQFRWTVHRRKRCLRQTSSNTWLDVVEYEYVGGSSRKWFCPSYVTYASGLEVISRKEDLSVFVLHWCCLSFSNYLLFQYTFKGPEPLKVLIQSPLMWIEILKGVWMNPCINMTLYEFSCIICSAPLSYANYS